MGFNFSQKRLMLLDGIYDSAVETQCKWVHSYPHISIHIVG